MNKAIHFLEKKIFDLLLIGLFLSVLLVSFIKQVQASQPLQTSVSPQLPSLPTTDRIWVAQGELYHQEDFYTCRVTCRAEWEQSEIGILQATRGSEDWLIQDDKAVKCHLGHRDSSVKYLYGGAWQTPAGSPEESLCFLVIKDLSPRPLK